MTTTTTTPKRRTANTPRRTLRMTRYASLGLCLALLGACATTGSGSTSARPVLYPNAKLNAVGKDAATSDIDQCLDNAKNAGLTPDEKTNAVAHDAAKGAAVGGAVGAVSGLLRGNNLLSSAAGGAAIGGAAGAANGAMTEKVNHTYRNFVQRCLKDKGYEVIGWN